MIEITFSSSSKEASAFGLTQWDKGQKLKIVWSDMPEKFQVHFASRNSQEAIVAEAQGQEGVAVVDIPDELLKNSADIFAWIYLTQDDNVGESVKRAVLYVRPRAKPHTLVDDLEESQQEILERILADIKESIGEGGSGGEYIPDYVVEEAEKVLSKVAENHGENSVVFIASSDAHLKTGDYNSETSLKHLSQAMNIVSQRYPIDFAAYLGDMTAGGRDKDIAEAKDEIMKVNEALYPSYHSIPSYMCPGTGDHLLDAYNRNGRYITQTQLRNMISKHNKNIIAPYCEEDRGYFYKDLEDVKIRVIFLNTMDNYDRTLDASSDPAFMSSNQLYWLCESLDLSCYDNYQEWGIILLGHHPLNMIDKFPLAVKILDSYTKGTEIYAACQDGTTILYDFSMCNEPKIIGQFHGHLHNYKVSFITDSKIPVVCIPNASFYNNNFYSDKAYTQAENLTYGEADTYNKTVNTANDTAFCVVVADRLTGKIQAYHYGAGVDRIIEDGTVTEESEDSGNTGSGSDNNGTSGGGGNNQGAGNYTNLVSSAKASDGNIYGTNGYADGFKLNTKGEVTASYGYTNTGYMVVGYGDTVRISGGNFDGTAGNYIIVYDSNFNILWVTTLTGDDDSISGISYTSEGVLKFYPSQVQTGNLENMAYIRVSTVGTGSELVVTRNEDIASDENSGGSLPPVVNYLNILQYATDKSGNVYGNGGYKDNMKLKSDGSEISASSYVASGYLELDSDAVIRTKGLTVDGAEGSCLCIYNSNYQLVRCIPLAGSSDSANGITYAKGIHTFTPADATSPIIGMVYFRISGKGTGNNLVITYCEEIN